MEHLSSFLDVIHRSGLARPDVVDLALQEFQREHPESTGCEAFAASLIAKKILTKWQVDYLMKGKSKGFILGQHKILSLIGRGGHAKVYLAEHLTLKQNRVIKVLAKEKIKGETSLLERFVREAQATASLDHKNIIRCFDIVVEPKLAYIVMEYCPGKDLDRVVREAGPLPFNKCVNYMLQICSGLEYVKNAGVIHRDIKPSNLLLTKTGEIKILDLGLALLEFRDEKDASLTQVFDDNLGTADYVAPEQARSSHQVDFRADIYSLGCTLYHFLTGRPPFHEGSIVQRVAKHQSEMPEPIQQLRGDCPPGLASVCWKMIQKNPADRYQSYHELATALRKAHSKLQQADGVRANRLAAATENSGQRGTAGNLQVPVLDGEPERPASYQVANPQFETQSVLSSDPTHAIPGDGSNPRDSSSFSSESLDSADLYPAPPSSNGLHMDGNWGTPAKRKPRKKSSRDDLEERAYQKFLQRERKKTLWIIVGLLVGIGISVAILLVNNANNKLKEELKPPPATNREG